jgi:hypothetical protein
MIKLFHESVPPLDLASVFMFPLVTLAHHSFLLELNLALLDTHLAFAEPASLLNPKLLAIGNQLCLINTHLLLKV